MAGDSEVDVEAILADFEREREERIAANRRKIEVCRVPLDAGGRQRLLPALCSPLLPPSSQELGLRATMNDLSAAAAKPKKEKKEKVPKGSMEPSRRSEREVKKVRKEGGCKTKFGCKPLLHQLCACGGWS